MQFKSTLAVLLFSFIVGAVNAQWVQSGTNESITAGTVGIGTTFTTYKLTVGNGLTGISKLSLFGYSGTSDNRSVSIQQLGNASSATQYFFMNGGLGSTSVFGTPTLTSMFTPTFGFESNDNNLNIIVAAQGTNVAPIRSMTFLNNGNVLLNKTTQGNSIYKLDVNGSARFNAVVVNTTGADYVFAPKYRLLPMQELEAYIAAHRHLPGVASADQMQQQGLNVGDHQTVLLSKVEELTLYMLQQNKRLEAQQKKIDHLEKLLRQKGIK